MTRFHTGHSYRSKSALRAQIAVQRETVLRKATRIEPPYTPTPCGPGTARIVDCDGYILMIGALGANERARLNLTHVEQHRHQGGVVWFPKETSDAA